MPKKTEPARIAHDFTSRDEADLNAQIAAFRARHEAEHGELLAMDARRSLGPGRDRVTFRVRPGAPSKKR